MKMMRRYFHKFAGLIISLLIVQQPLQAQNVGINATGAIPDASAILDISSADKGLLIPRVALSSTTSNAPVGAGIATGLMVYNTATAGVSPNNVLPGFYYWEGTKWIAFGGQGGKDWGLNGNAGTTAANYIGTTDATELHFRTNNTNRVRLSTNGQIETLNTGSSVFIGEGAGDSDNLTNNRNSFVGYESGFSNTNGYDNVAVGHHSLRSNVIGRLNVALGYNALDVGTGNLNVAVGGNALGSSTTGSVNVAVGNNALAANTTAFYNVAIGSSAMNSNTTGTQNLAAGNFAMYRSVSGDHNTAIGARCFFNAVSSDYNTALGSQSLYWNTTGQQNTALGAYAFFSGAAYSNSTAIGYNASITASNQVRIGNASVTSIGGYANWSNLSDGRFKINVQETVPGLAFIKKLRPVTYHLDMEAIAAFQNLPDSIPFIEDGSPKSGSLQTGFIAQEVEVAAKSLGFAFSGVDAPESEEDFYALRYAEFVVPLVKSVQELSAQNNTLETKLEEQAAMIKALQQQLIEQGKKIDALQPGQ